MGSKTALGALLLLAMVLTGCDITTTPVAVPVHTPVVDRATPIRPTVTAVQLGHAPNRSAENRMLNMSDPATYAGATIEFSPTQYDADMPAFKGWKTIEELTASNGAAYLESGDIAASEVVRLTQFPGEQIVLTACSPLPCDVGRFYIFAVAEGTAAADRLSEARIFSYNMVQYRVISEGWTNAELQPLDGRFTIKFTDGGEFNYVIYAGGIFRHYSPEGMKQDQEILNLLSSWQPALQQIWAARHQ